LCFYFFDKPGKSKTGVIASPELTIFAIICFVAEHKLETLQVRFNGVLPLDEQPIIVWRAVEESNLCSRLDMHIVC
jgi:hypothetical protein